VRCIKHRNEVGIPVKENVANDVDVQCSDDGSFVLNGISFYIIQKKICMPCPRMRRLMDVTKAVMRNKRLWEESLKVEIPTSWEQYGDLLLFNGDKYFKNLAWSEAG
jgi:hypothetical protein